MIKLEGKRIQCSMIQLLSELYHEYRITYEIPIMTGKFILISDLYYSIGENIIQVCYGNIDYNLDSRATLLLVLENFKKLTIADKKYLEKASEYQIRKWYHFGIKEQDIEQSIFNLFKALTDSKHALIKEFYFIDLPVKVVFNSVITVLYKAQNYKDMHIDNKRYVKLLSEINRSVFNVKQKAISFLESKQTGLDLLKFLLELREK
jgi:hypothetical protein